MALAAALAGSAPITSRPQPAARGLIRHVVIIIQENRTIDNLFNGFPGANTAAYGKNSKGEMVRLHDVSLNAPYDLSHTHAAFVTQYAQGNMDGFDRTYFACKKDAPARACPDMQTAAYGRVPESEIEPYWDMARNYTLGDDMFETNQGPSFPSHQYLVSGTSTIADGAALRVAENPLTPKGETTGGGCDADPTTSVAVIDRLGSESASVYPCFDRVTLMREASAAHVTWRYYQAAAGAGLWNAPDAIRSVRDGDAYGAVVAPSAQVLDDIYEGHLADIVWVTPTAAASDHPGVTDGTGPMWVASIVDAIGESSYWSDTAIFVTWDDWGGWFDHVTPPVYNSYELGFRVPLIVISPYAKEGYVSHVQHEYGSILRFTEESFGLPSMHTTDARADDLADCFDFKGPIHGFIHIRTTYSPQYFLHQPISNEPPDDDW